MPRKYLFIDGGFLRGFLAEMREKFVAECPAITPSLNLQSIGSGFDRILYYDAYPEPRDDQSQTAFQEELAATEALFDELSSLRNFSVRPALTRRGKRRQQKGVDVLLAIECLMHAIRSNIDEATIMTSDLDFFPLFEALLQTRTKSVLQFKRRVPQGNWFKLPIIPCPSRHWTTCVG